MEGREQHVAAVRNRLARIAAARDLSPVLEPGALEEARTLTEVLRDDDGDLEARVLLGWLHYYRYQILPAGEDGPDLRAAVDVFTPCFIDDADHLPKRLLPLLAERAVPDATLRLVTAVGSADQELISAAVVLWQRILEVTPTQHAERASYLFNLGNALEVKFERGGAPADLDEDLDDAITAFQAAVGASSLDDPNLEVYRSHLGSMLYARFLRAGAREDLDDAIVNLEAAVFATASDDPDRARYLADLGVTLRVRFELIGAQADLDHALSASKAAVQATPPEGEDWAARLSSLGNVLHARFRRSRARADLDDAIANLDAALDATPTDGPQRADRLSDLAGSLQARFRHTGTLADLDRAIAAIQAAVDATPAEDPQSALFLSNLGSALQTRFQRTGALADLDRAISVGDAAVKATRAGHPDYGRYVFNLGAAMLRRFGRTGVPADLDSAIGLGEAAVNATPDQHSGLGGRLSNLGLALRLRFERFGALADLDGAIAAGQQAVEVTPAEHPDRADYLSNLGEALQRQFERSGALADLDRAITTVAAAAEAVSVDDPHLAGFLVNLGNALLTRFQRARSRQDLEAAFSAYGQAVDVGGAEPWIRILAARQAASLIGRSEPGRAADLLETAVRLLPEVAPRQLERGDQQHALGGLAGLAGDAAALALADSTTDIQERSSRALRLLEAGRAVLLSQALDTRSDVTDLTERDPELAARFAELRDMLDRPVDHDAPGASMVADTDIGRHGHMVEDRNRLADEFNAILQQIRSLDGFARFGLPPEVEELVTEAAFGPVVVFNVSAYRSDALLLTRDGITSFELPDLTYGNVTDQVNAFQQALDATANPNASPRDRQDAQAGLSTILEWLWDSAAEPVLRILGHYGQPPASAAWPRLWLAPGGLLGRLPLQAAGYHNDPPDDPGRRTVMDRVICSNTPTVRALRYARESMARPTTAPRALIVAMPTTPGVAGWLQNVAAEATKVAERVPGSVLLIEPSTLDNDSHETSSEVPTKANVLAHLPNCPIVHFACHARSDAADPSKSLLLLHDYESDPFTVAGLASIQVNEAQLAYLSACSTASTRTEALIDEAIHLTSAFQLAGFPQVIGTLWEIVDSIAIDVADSFYSNLRTSDGTLDTSQAAQALHESVRAVRDRAAGRPFLWAAYLHAGA
jgi:tetratricopeptide (TPR) repeat protein